MIKRISPMSASFVQARQSTPSESPRAEHFRTRPTVKARRGSFLALLSCLAFLTGGIAFAQIIVSDPFTDGARTDGADPLDIAYFRSVASTGSGLVFAVNNSFAGFVGNSLAVDPSGDFQSIVGSGGNGIKLRAI